MTKTSGIYEARGQIAWILALIISTAVVVRLEQLELGSQMSALATNPLAETELASDITLQQARFRIDDLTTAPVTDQVYLLTALVLAAMQDGADIATLRKEAEQAVTSLESTAPTDRLLLDAITLCRGVFKI